jgi:DNA-binding NarL/FixJ family response regulator
MGGITGLDLVRSFSGGTVPALVLLSSFGAPSLVAEALRAGASGWVLKGDAVDDLLTAVAAVSEGEVFISSGIPKDGLREAMVSLGPSPRELEVLRHLAEGRTTAEVAALLGIGLKTVETHRSHLFIKLGVPNVAAAVAEGIRSGWLPSC